MLTRCRSTFPPVVVSLILAAVASIRAAEPRPTFNRDVRPILSDKCFVCHGPDAAQRQADLRLDRREDAVQARETPAIVPGDPDRSELIRRILSMDPDLQMPPPQSRLSLTTAEQETLRRWIADGAAYERHWAFLPPQPVVPPDSPAGAAVRQPVDAFLLQRLEREGLTPEPEADRITLLRRVSFDLTGLPPSPEEVAAFLDDPSADAFERVIDRLLASPRYGERMATPWLDAARYADTNGYQTDGPRFMWRWRDWVIDAFNQNQPFDEFTIDQLAGDLLEIEQGGTAHPTVASARRIATGFNRNHRGNAEGGIIPEEFRIEYVVDRVETTSAVWLGLTLGCARCHDHKYDPVSQREFYQLFACFNQVPEPGKYIRNSNSMPYLPAPTLEQQRQLAQLDQQVEQARLDWAAREPELKAGLSRCVAELAAGTEVAWDEVSGLVTRLSFDGNLANTGSEVPAAGDSSFTDRGLPATFAPGRIGTALTLTGQAQIESAAALDFGEDEVFAISLWVKPEGTGAMTILARMDHENSSRGIELRREADGRLQALFSGRILDDLIRVESADPLPAGAWSHVLVSYDGSSAARGVGIRINGEPQRVTIRTDLLSNPIRVKTPLRLGGGGSAGPFVGALDELRTYRGHLPEETARSLAAGTSLSEIARRGAQANSAETARLREYYLAVHAPESLRRTRQYLRDAEARRAAFLASIPTTMVMEDQQQVRETFLLKRGEYDKPGERVEPALPAVLIPVGRDTQLTNRLQLARWLVSPENPLTARVTINRLWQSLFGSGLVRTPEDFGTQGEVPSHPELLDWLAVEFSGTVPGRVPRAWDVKRLVRGIVSSTAYRRSSEQRGLSARRDPENRWYARGPRFRLPAEMIRDAALAASGLLVEVVGGPSVKPYQPPGLWEELSAEAVPGPFAVYVPDQGANLYRRSLYTYRKRTVPPPALALFDASPREACRVSLPRTNTPLQALNLMNDVTYVEAARVLAERVLREGDSSPSARMTWLFRQILSRPPRAGELAVLMTGFERRRAHYQKHPEEAERLRSQGQFPVDRSVPAPDVAAWLATASVLLNLDEFVMRP